MPGLTRSRSPIRRALSVAVRYTSLGVPHILPGTHQDTDMLTRILTEFMHFKEEDIVILKDDDDGTHRKPTHENILEEMRKLLDGAGPNDHFVFHFSGHGDQIPNTNGTEEDGMDEIIWPVDVELNPDGSARGKYIMDDTINDILVKHTPPGAHFMMIFDCCHSGTAADLPNSSSHQPPPKSLRVHATVHRESHEKKLVKHKVDMPDVTSWAACADDELTPGSSKRGGIFLNTFYEALRNNREATRGELLQDITERIKRQVREYNHRVAKRHMKCGETCRRGCQGGYHSGNSAEPIEIPCPSPELGANMPLDTIYNEHVLDEDYD